jgi:hypothetical protein
MRLDALADVMDEAGFRAGRAEIVAALICGALPDAEDLSDLVRSYRRASVADVALAERIGEHLELPATHPGPRSR